MTQDENSIHVAIWRSGVEQVMFRRPRDERRRESTCVLSVYLHNANTQYFPPSSYDFHPHMDLPAGMARVMLSPVTTLGPDLMLAHCKPSHAFISSLKQKNA